LWMTPQLLLQLPLLVLLQLLELLLLANRHTMYRYISLALHFKFSIDCQSCMYFVPPQQLSVEAGYVHACCSHRAGLMFSVMSVLSVCHAVF